MKSLRILLPIIAALLAFLLLKNGEETSSTPSPLGFLQDPQLETSLGESAEIDAPLGVEERKPTEAIHLLRALHLDGTPTSKTTFFLEEDGRNWKSISNDGTLTIPADGPSLRVAALCDGLWSKVHTLQALERTEKSESLLLIETQSAKAHLWIHHSDQTPVQNFRVQARWAGQLEAESLSEARRGTLWTRVHDWEIGSLGTTDYLQLPPGKWTFKAQADGMAEATASLELLPGDSKTLSLLLVEGAFVQGQALQGEDSPLAGAVAMLLRDGAESYLELVPPDERGFLSPTNGKTETDSKGKFRVGPVEAGTYRLQLGAEGFQAWISDPFEIAIGSEKSLPPQILQRGPGLLVEVVHAVDQSPIPHAEVSWLGNNPLTSMVSSLIPWEKGGETDSQGRLQLENMPLLGVQVRARAEGFSASQASSNPDSKSLRIELYPAISVTGKVFDKHTLQPIAQAEIRAWQEKGDLLGSMMGGMGDASNYPSINAGKDGRFTLDGLGPGEWNIRAEAEDYAPQTLGPIRLSPEAPIQDLEIPMGPGATVLITVLDDHGLPQAGSLLALNSFEGPASPDGKQTDSNGLATFEHLPMGYYQFQAFQPGFQSGALAAMQGDLSGLETLSTFLRIDEEKIYELELGGAILPSSISGFVTRADQPVEGLTIMLNSLSGMKTAKTDDIGYYELENVREGDYMLLVGQFGLGSGVGIYQTLHVSPGEAIQHDIDIPATRVRVLVQDSQTGEPLSNIPVMLRPSLGSAGGGYLNSDPDGIAYFDLLEPANYVLSVGHSAMPIFGGGQSYSTVILEDFYVGENETREVVVPLSPAAQVEATVLDSFGEPIQGAGVFACSPSGQAIGPFSLNTTDAKGQLKLGSLPEGELVILARHSSFGTVQKTVHLQVGQREEIELILQAGCMLKIQVLDSEQQPKPGVIAVLLNQANIPVSNMMAGPEAISYGMNSMSGGEQSIGPFAPGEYILLLSDSGGQNKRQKITIEPGVPEMRFEIEY
ncbi:MAG: carboxypeptidase-like regulatory domain-containing protein [Planctomycetota bacterium]|nr:carboxypeptidase-like regulatory domain-containing protein [Planctomycetota bacterium]